MHFHYYRVVVHNVLAVPRLCDQIALLVRSLELFVRGCEGIFYSECPRDAYGTPNSVFTELCELSKSDSNEVLCSQHLESCKIFIVENAMIISIWNAIDKASDDPLFNLKMYFLELSSSRMYIILERGK